MDTEERDGRMSDDFMEEEFERDRNEAFRLRELVEARLPWDVVKRQFQDLDRVELVISVNEYDKEKLSRWLEIYGNGDRWHTSLKPKWLDEVLPDDEARVEMKRHGVVEIKRILYSTVSYP